MSAAVFATSGAATLQGPHQSAQKSTRIGTRALFTTSRKVSRSTGRGSRTGEISFLHAPQRPVSARRSAGERFFFPQEEQVRITLQNVSQCPRTARPGERSRPYGGPSQ